MANNNFSDLGLSDWLVRKLAAIGIKKPSKIQREVVPFLVREHKRNVFACSETGTGKTLAYVLPILERLVYDPRPYFALIFAPTRELANQIHDIVKILTGADGKNSTPLVKSLLVIGGGNYGVETNDENVQGLWLGKPNIIVATPGRFLDQIINRNYLDVCGTMRSFRFDMLVMDEADQLITSGFCEQMKTLLDWIDSKEVGNSRRQTVVLSATLSPALEKLREIISSKDRTNQPFVVNLLPTLDKVKQELATNPYLDQRYILCPHNVKPAYLIEALLDMDFKQLIIFCGTKREAKLMHKILITLGFAGKEFNFEPVLLNSDLKQSLRFAAIDKFKSLKSRILVTTDLASRGLDLPLVDLIINYNCPKSAVSYVHRVGRTCRKPNVTASSTIRAVDDLEVDDINREDIEKSEAMALDKKEADDTAIKTLKPRKKRVKSAYLGKSLTFVSQYDIDLMKNIESFIGIKMDKEKAIDEEHVNEILKQVTFACKDAELAIEREEAIDEEIKGPLHSKHHKQSSPRKRKRHAV
ncbi:putative ATP-dependent RNA helicase DDX49 [Brevipalpus obovatus]|uniref:putative ATP-dependent RNA helicase DDX49 n=1 Tax=Brevipalpus obovatus TaxID=246614 RepID=UPI003D9EB921